MDYEQKIRDPGDAVSSGADMLRIFGYTDIQNPYVGFDLMNDSNFNYLKTSIKNGNQPHERYNANIIRLRDYRLGGIMNDFRSLCDGALHLYEDAWQEYRAEYNPSMPEEFYQFWMLYDTVTLDTIFPKFVNLIDPISMTWIDPEYPKVTCVDGVYQYKIDTPIMTSDAMFLHPESKMEYQNFQPAENILISIWEEAEMEVTKFLPLWLLRVEYLNHELEHTPEIEGETEAGRIQRIKSYVRRVTKNTKK